LEKKRGKCFKFQESWKIWNDFKPTDFDPEHKLKKNLDDVGQGNKGRGGFGFLRIPRRQCLLPRSTAKYPAP
jgi:hypothetical protein